MIKRFMKCLILILPLLLCGKLHAQKKGQPLIDSLLQELLHQKEDTNKVKLLSQLSRIYANIGNSDDDLKYSQMGLDLATRLDWKKGEALGFNNLARNYQKKDYSKALEYNFKSLNLFEEIGNRNGVAAAFHNIGAVYMNQGEYAKSLEYNFKAKNIYEEVLDKNGIGKVTNSIGIIYYAQGNYPKALEYHLKAYKILEETGDKRLIAYSTCNIGNIYDKQGDHSKALEYYFKSLKISEEAGDKPKAADIFNGIGSVYCDGLKEYPKALEYFFKALKLSEETGNKILVATVTGNIGNVYINQKNFAIAITYYQKALKIATEFGDKRLSAAELSFIGEAYLASVTDTPAKAALETKNPEIMNGEDMPAAVDMPHSKDGRLQKAIDYIQHGLALSKEINVPDIMQQCNKNLAEAYKLSGDYKRALEFTNNYQAIKDSVFSAENDKKIMKLGMENEYEKKEALAKAVFVHQQDSLKLENERKELDMKKEIELSALKFEYEKKQAAARTEKEKRQLAYEEEMKRNKLEFDYEQKRQAIVAEQKQNAIIAKVEQEKRDNLALQKLQRQRTYSYVGGGVALLLLCFCFFIVKERGKSERERKKSDDLLLNILPAEVAQELKANGATTAKNFDNVTVLFTDFVGFTTASERMTPQELVNELHTCFQAFDGIVGKYNIEKIKTVGDAYLAVAGLPISDPNHAQNIVEAAIKINAFIQDRVAKMGNKTFQIRIGIHSGSVVAGIVGVKKFAYDIWGDTVNTAARMEQNCEPSRINISQTTYELVKDNFKCEYRGEIDAKGKGMLKMYYVV